MILKLLRWTLILGLIGGVGGLTAGMLVIHFSLIKGDVETAVAVLVWGIFIGALLGSITGIFVAAGKR